MRLPTETPRHRASRGENEDQVFDVLKSAPRPLSAYDILDVLKGSSIKAAVQVYRALDRLIAQGKVHRIESLNAFVVCSCEVHRSPPGFFICGMCKAAVEFDPAQGLGMMQTAIKGFEVQQANVELRGMCSACSAQNGKAP